MANTYKGLELLPCPFCGKKVDLDDWDTLYPSGTVWRYNEELELRTYHRIGSIAHDGACHTMHCPTPSGGCGAEISADSAEEAVVAWNRRVNKEIV